jgi:hypothetical protein
MKWHKVSDEEWRSITMRQDGVQIVAVTRRVGDQWFWRVEADGREAWVSEKGRTENGAKNLGAKKQVQLFRIYRSRGTPRADGAHTPEWVARMLGFTGAAEMLTMLADVDQTKPGVSEALNEWHQRGGSKEELAKFPRRQG